MDRPAGAAHTALPTRWIRRRLVEDALRHANQGVAGSMEGHAAMDMSVTGQGSFWRRLTSALGLTAVSHIFVMEWAAIWRDIIAGLLITGALAAWVPTGVWKSFYDHDASGHDRRPGLGAGE